MNLDPPPLEDSADLTEEEVGTAIDTRTLDEFSSMLAEMVKTEGSPQRHELRRKGSHLYCRTTFLNKVLLFRVSWLGA